MIIEAYIKKGWMQKPTYTQIKTEFGDIGNKSGYNKYLDKKMFTDLEIQGALELLK